MQFSLQGMPANTLAGMTELYELFTLLGIKITIYPMTMAYITQGATPTADAEPPQVYPDSDDCIVNLLFDPDSSEAPPQTQQMYFNPRVKSKRVGADRKPISFFLRPRVGDAVQGSSTNIVRAPVYKQWLDLQNANAGTAPFYGFKYQVGQGGTFTGTGNTAPVQHGSMKITYYWAFKTRKNVGSQ